MEQENKKPGKRNDYARETSFVYGDQTWGVAYSKLDAEFDVEGEAVNNVTKYISESLEKLNISKEDLKKMTVLDIGTGRQAAWFQKNGAEKVYHFDISKAHIDHTKKYCEVNNIKNLESHLGDLIKDKLPEEKFDFVFAAGIYQHLMPPHMGLINFAQSLKVGGKMYMGFYRSGDWRWFIVSMIRKGVTKKNFSKLKNKISVSCAKGDASHFQVARMLDDFFVPGQSLFHPEDIIHDTKECGLETVFIEDDMREYCHESKNYHSVGGDRIYLQKAKHFSYEDLAKKEFKTSKGKDQFFDIPYKEEIILENIDKWLELVDLYNHGFIDEDIWLDVLINMYRFARPWNEKKDDYFSEAQEKGRHIILGGFLSRIKNNFVK